MENSELKIWFENLKNNNTNRTTIFLNTNYLIRTISNVNVINYMEKDVLKKSNKIYFKDMNLDIYNSHCDKFFNSIFGEPIIIINDEQSVKKFLDLLKNYNNQNDIEIDIEYYLVAKKDFNELLQMDSQKLSELLQKEDSYLKTFYPKLPIYNEEFIFSSINILKDKNILTASFANYLYKFAYLDFTLSSTKVGREIRKLLGIRSKTINDIRTIDVTFPYGKPFKGYDLSEDKNLEIKKKIAQKLLNLGNKKLDIKKIAEITELPINIVENSK